MEPFIGQIQPFGFNFAPRGWAQCNGQLLAIASNTALFSLLGTMYGGDGRTNFALPDLRGRSIVHVGTGPGLTPITQGERGGVEHVALTNVQLPPHTHGLTTVKVNVSTTANDNATAESDNGANGLGTAGTMPDIYRENPGGADFLGGVSIEGATDSTGAGQAFDTRNPYLGINVCIALQGIFPSRS